jgi:hypothetical protein
MDSKGNSCALLMGVQSSTAIMENYEELPHKEKHGIII